MKRFFAVLLVCLGLYACKPGIPKDIIQPDKMEKVLFDIHVVDGYISTMSPTADSTKKIASAYYKGVYKKFQIDSVLYNKSLNYYYQHADLLKKMYDNVTTQLNKTKDKELKALQKAPDTVKPVKTEPKAVKDTVAPPKKDTLSLVKKHRRGQVPIAPSKALVPKK